MQESLTTLWERIQDLVAAGLLSVFGGSAAYVYKTMKEEQGFRLSRFLMNAFLAFFIGNLIGSFIPIGANYRDGLLMLAGFTTWPLLGLVEIYGTKWAEKFLSDKTGAK